MTIQASAGVSSSTPAAASETVQDEHCLTCGRPGHLARYGPGHDVLFARVTPFDFHRYAPSPYMRRLYALRKEVEAEA